MKYIIFILSVIISISCTKGNKEENIKECCNLTTTVLLSFQNESADDLLNFSESNIILPFDEFELHYEIDGELFSLQDLETTAILDNPNGLLIENSNNEIPTLLRFDGLPFLNDSSLDIVESKLQLKVEENKIGYINIEYNKINSDYYINKITYNNNELTKIDSHYYIVKLK